MSRGEGAPEAEQAKKNEKRSSKKGEKETVEEAPEAPGEGVWSSEVVVLMLASRAEGDRGERCWKAGEKKAQQRHP